MREEFEKFLQTVHQGTTLDELSKNCQTEQELSLALEKARGIPCVKNEELSADWKEKAWAVFKDAQTAEIDTKNVQITLSVGYHLALQIRDWLLQKKSVAQGCSNEKIK